MTWKMRPPLIDCLDLITIDFLCVSCPTCSLQNNFSWFIDVMALNGTSPLQTMMQHESFAVFLCLPCTRLVQGRSCSACPDWDWAWQSNPILLAILRKSSSGHFWPYNPAESSQPNPCWNPWDSAELVNCPFDPSWYSTAITSLPFRISCHVRFTDFKP